MNTIQSNQDSIVEEIHNTRERLAEMYHNDLLAYSQATQEHCIVLYCIALGFSLVDSPRLRHLTAIKKIAINV